MQIKAIISKITTSIDGGLRIQFDISEDQVGLAKELLDMRDEVLSLEIKTIGLSGKA